MGVPLFGGNYHAGVQGLGAEGLQGLHSPNQHGAGRGGYVDYCPLKRVLYGLFGGE